MQLGEDTTTMSMTLNPVNKAAFQKAVQSLETLNRAAVFHPTGTGKSCIAWKVVEAHPQTTFFWLVAGAQRLALRQAELTRYNGGTLPGNVRFCDCEKLAAATPEQWVRLGEQKPGCIVLDCYHELSAVCWAQSVQKLLRMCPQAKVLGLGVPNGAPVCAAAQELFADCIVSHMTLWPRPWPPGPCRCPQPMQPCSGLRRRSWPPCAPGSKTCVCPRATPPCAFNMKS